MTTREAVVTEAMTWLRTPYHHQARVKGAGVDCAQLLIQVYSKVGLVPEIDVGNYPHDWHMHNGEERFLGWIQKYGKQVEQPKAGDIALFKFGRCVSHGSIVVEWPTIIHAYFRSGCILSSAHEVDLKGRLHSFWTLWE